MTDSFGIKPNAAGVKRPLPHSVTEERLKKKMFIID
jgi:hypothetical protein